MDTNSVIFLCTAWTVAGFLLGVQAAKIAAKRHDRKLTIERVNRILAPPPEPPKPNMRVVARNGERS